MRRAARPRGKHLARRGIRGAVVTGLRWLVPAAALVVFVAVAVGPHLFGYRTLTVLTGSMAPTIPAGSVVVVTPVEAERLDVGDVLTYRIPVGEKQVVTHRIVEIVEDGPAPVIRTQGDAMDETDPWLSRVTGTAWVVRAHVPTVGYAVWWLRQPEVRTGLLYGSAATFALVALIGIWAPRRAAASGPRHLWRPPYTPWGRWVVCYDTLAATLVVTDRRPGLPPGVSP